MTSGMLRGVSIGGIVVPILLGYLMRAFGPGVLTLSLCLLGLGIVLCYIFIHVTLTRESEMISRKASVSGAPQHSHTGEHPCMSAHNNAQMLIRSLTILEEEKPDWSASV